VTPASTDAALMSRLMRGEAAAFEEIVAQHRGPVYGYLRARVLQPSDAEDLAQEVFLRFYLARARFDSSNMLRPWLLGIARNLIREHVRAVRKRKEVGWAELCLDLEGAAPEALDDEAVTRLPACLDALGPSAREAIELKYRQNWKLSKIGERLRRSEGAVKLLVFRARQALRNCLERRAAADTPE
jgi:RNA polymerase sigma-70 factor (ECF subfamily)